MTKWICDKFLALRHQYRAEETGIYLVERATQPNIEEIGEVRIYVDTCQTAGAMVSFLLEHVF